MTDHINTEGMVSVGELNTRLMREAKSAEDYHNAYVAGQVEMAQSVVRWCEEQIRMAGPFDDIRPLEFLIIHMGDRIREVQRATP